MLLQPDQTHLECDSNLMEILPQIQEKFNVFFLKYGFCPQVRVKTIKKGLHKFVVPLAGIWDLLELSDTFLSKRPGRFLLVGREY